ncbi:MAG: hypothetical protein LBP80_06450 [Treponema sp.]|nr:hypothetical protein [Treponema sp.]
MKKNKLFLLGMLAALLAFGLVLAGCENDPSDSTAEKALIITGVSDSMLGQSTEIGILPVGKASSNDAVAGASGEAISLSDSAPYTVTVRLYDASNSTARWTGSGTYDVYILDGDTPKYKASSVTLSSVATMIPASDFLSLPQSQ